MEHNRPEQPDTVETRLESSRDYPRLDVCLASETFDLTRAAARRLILEGDALLDGVPQRPSQPVRKGQFVTLRLPAPPGPPQPEPWQLTKVYEDTEMLIIDKPAGLVVHPAPGHRSSTLVNMLLGAYAELPGTDESRPGIVHRLDKDTSGLLIVAKTERARQWLVNQFKSAGIKKTYLALVLGSTASCGIIEQPIGRHPVHRKRMAVVEGGRYAHTSYSVCEYAGGFSLVSASPTTGRTHQIRVHFASIGHPVAGDLTYGGRPARHALQGVLHRHFLHAHRLAFSPPWVDSPLDLTTPLPEDLQHALNYVRRLDA
ncbi:MAG: RluA family pseudouridine synthase [Chloroflexota bacterium]